MRTDLRAMQNMGMAHHLMAVGPRTFSRVYYGSHVKGEASAAVYTAVSKASVPQWTRGKAVLIAIHYTLID